MKQLTREQVQARKDKAVRFVRDVQGDPERAAEIEQESLEDYAARRKFQIVNPQGRRFTTVPRKTVEDYKAEIADLKEEVAELEDENESLQDQLDEIAGIVSGEEEEEEVEGEEADELD